MRSGQCSGRRSRAGRASATGGAAGGDPGEAVAASTRRLTRKVHSGALYAADLGLLETPCVSKPCTATTSKTK
eukprot:scaffold54108_cov23-Tisochrysis_lutea.AAC.1